MKLRILKFILPILVIFAVFTSFQNHKSVEKNNDPKDKVLLTILKYVLTQGHYQPQDINDAFSEKLYTAFLTNLDPSKRYFLQSDIDAFSKYKDDLDDEINNDELTFFNVAYDTLMVRIKQVQPYYKELLAHKFDYDENENLDVDYKKLPYAANKAALIAYWEKQMKFSTLSRLYDKQNDESDKKKTDSTYTKKPFDVLEKEAREATLSNLDDTFNRIDELTYEDWFSVYANSIAEEFDPHTSYFEPSVKKQFDIEMAGKLEGIGARLTKKNDYTKVDELISGGPAWKEGELEVGDIILKVAQGDKPPVDIVGMRLDDAIEYIKGKKGTEVKLTVKKLDGTIKVISIIRDVVELDETFVKSTIVEKNGKKFALIDLPKFYMDFDEKDFRNAATDMAKEIERLKKEDVQGLIIDLRNNGGGSLQTAIDISGLFIKKGPVVQVRYRDSKPDVKSVNESKIAWNKPLVILVNELSASASEIFAAAMQDYGRAVIIGSKQTYGKGTVQTILDLNRYHNLNTDLGALKMTIQKFYRINGGSTQLEGVHSDIILPDKYNYMDIGERDNEHPLAFDKVAPALYTPWNNYENFKQIISQSKSRIAQNKYFNLIDSYAHFLKKSQDDSIIPLNINAYKKDIKTNEAESLKYKPIEDYTNNLTFTSPLYEKDECKTDKDLADKRAAWHKNLKRDIYVDEALNVLSELKLKPQLRLVNN